MSEIADVIRDIEHVLLSRGAHHALIFSDVEDIQGRGRYSSGDCPLCGHKGKFRISNERAVSSCWSGSCSWSGSWHNWLEYAERQGRASDWESFYRELAREAGIEWPERDAQSQARYQAKKDRESLLEDAARLMSEALQQPAGAAVSAYWRSRGYSDEAISEMGLGAYPGQQKLLQALQALGHDEQAIREADLISPKWDKHPAIMPWRDRAGQPAGLMGRAIEEDVEPKYLYSKGLSRSQMLPGLEQARRHDELILLESPLAAAYLNAQGLARPAVALGGASLSKAQIEALQQARAKRLILALDADEAGQKATGAIIKALLEIEEIERLLIATWPEAQGKGLDDLAIKQGLEAAGAAVDRAERVGSWLARRLAQTLPEPAEALEEEALLERAVEQYLWLARGDAIQARDYVGALAEGLGWDEGLLWPRMAKAEERLREKESKQLIEAHILQAMNALVKGDRPAAVDALEQARAAARASQPVKLPEPYLWSQVERDITQEPDALKTDWASLNRQIGIPRAALSVIGAQSGHGKTTMMLNLLSSWSTLYPADTFYFYSYEEPASHISLKLIMMRAGVELSQAQNYLAYVNYLKFHRAQGTKPAIVGAPGGIAQKDWPAMKDKIEQAIQWYEERASSGRLILDYSMPSVEELAATLSLLGKRGGVGAVIVDYIQRVPSDGKAQTRQLELAATTQRLREAAVSHGLAILTGSQLNEQKELREARDIYHEAHLVLELEQAQQGDSLDVTVKKYRAGRAGGKITLDFNKPILKLLDRSSPAGSPGQWGP